MPVVHRDARTDHLPPSTLTAQEMGLLAHVFEHALQSQEFMRLLAAQVGAIADRRPGFRKMLAGHLKAKGTGTRERRPEELLDVLIDLLEAEADGLKKGAARELVGIKHSKSPSTIEDIEREGRAMFPKLRVVLDLKRQAK
ncbi:hypothetical protein [Roseateles sp. LYH14W]|uniref:Uncharacterized protein n=1 Tax=Pelomonas parva TaxID=3299032 RepID=A0ABW7EVV5_9BURK